MKREIKKVNPADLKQHPENKRIYSQRDNEALKESILERGLLQPIIINTKEQVLCGWRRLQAILAIGWPEIEVEVEPNIPEEDEAAFIVESNRIRIKDTVEIYREAKVLKERWAKKQGQRTDLQEGLSDEDKNDTRKRIANKLGVTETGLYRIETVGDKDIKMLELVDAELITLHEAYQACKLDKPKEDLGIEEIDLTDIPPCPFCGCETKRIEKAENGNLKFKNN